MSFTPNLPPSVLSKEAKEAELHDVTGEEKTKRREDYKKLKELEEARKAGTVPAMQDEEGKDINPHIPQYIMQAPWYFGAKTATLRHQRQQDEKIQTYDGLDKWYKKGVKEGPVATKYRKGACENCGAMTHTKKDCLERPRKLGAKFTGSEIAPDEHLQVDVNHDYEGKRDRWNGYDVSQHKKIFEEFQKMEEAKKFLKAQRLEDGVEGEESQSEEEEEDKGDDEDKYAEDMVMPGQKFETKQRITVRNLRIREDTAKYLYNLDVNSAYYDPKTRSMRENPFPGKHSNEIPFAGDNFARSTGDAQNIAKAQMFAWEAYEEGADVHLQADPTKLAALSKEHTKRKSDFKSKAKDSILEKYGGEEHLDAPPKQLLMAQTEDYVEYSRHGTVIKGQEKAKVKSRYEEDIYNNNHTSVWGSFWKEGKWGYKCCHSTIKESYCTGEAGKTATESNPMLDSLNTASGKVSVHSTSQEGTTEAVDKASVDEEKQAILDMIAAQRKKMEKRKRKKKDKKHKKKDKKHKKKKRKKESSSSSGESSSSESEDEDLKKEKRIKEAIAKEKARVREVERMMEMDERKRPYNSMTHIPEPTEEELEAFRRTQKNFDDPMAQFM